MAQRTITTLIDDLTGGEADETVTFGLDGRTYEIDLNAKNSKKLRAALDDFIKAGRKTGGRTNSSRPKTSKAGNNGPSTADIRTWAKKNGYDINDRGRVPAPVKEAFDKAHEA
ncbi:Lsr2 family protein [Streptomyces sp. NPDC018584]|uniref:histone-like nucleoid-structuring protein Lsr2 n=1 Tax=unclassified Streptomyces TaxID=2593676 RepID=UPI0037888A6D